MRVRGGSRFVRSSVGLAGTSEVVGERDLVGGRRSRPRRWLVAGGRWSVVAGRWSVVRGGARRGLVGIRGFVGARNLGSPVRSLVAFGVRQVSSARWYLRCTVCFVTPSRIAISRQDQPARRAVATCSASSCSTSRRSRATARNPVSGSAARTASPSPTPRSAPRSALGRALGPADEAFAMNVSIC